VRALRGTTKWEGNLNDMRQDRVDYSVLWDDKKPTSNQTAKRTTKHTTKRK
jgi:hypothetical protein